MLKGKRIRLSALVMTVMVLLLLFTPSVSAIRPRPQSRLGEVEIWEGQEAIELYADLTGRSIEEVEEAIEQTRKSKGVHHWGWYVPSCMCPPHGAAYALFETGPGSVTVQFHGNRLWVGYDYCPYTMCTFIASASMLSGDEIWLYSVTNPISADIDHWCSGGPVPASPGQ